VSGKNRGNRPHRNRQRRRRNTKRCGTGRDPRFAGPPATEDEVLAVEQDAVREMGGDDFLDYEAMTGKEIGNK